MGRWRIALGAVLTHVCLGSVYAWSVFIPALQRQTGWTRPQLTWAFSLAIACLGLTAALIGEPRFWLLWSVFFVNIATGILLIALARPMLEESAALARGSAIPAVTAVAVMGLCNGLGRLGWSSLSDRLGRTSTWMLMFLVQGVMFYILRGSASPRVLAIGLWLIASCYGGAFAICPALVADAFGSARAPAIYGLSLTAWGAAALLSPPLAAWLRETLGSYTAILGTCALASGVGLGLVYALGRAIAHPAGVGEPVGLASDRG